MLNEFLFTKIWRGGYCQHLVSTGRRYVPHNRNYTRCFAPFFLNYIIIRRADVVWPLLSWDLTQLDYYLWSAVKDKCYADKPETIDALKDNIREAIGEIQLHTIDNVLKNWQPRQPFEWYDFPLLTGKIVLSNKKRNLRKYSVVFF